MRFWEEIVDNKLNDCIVDDVPNFMVVVAAFKEGFKVENTFSWGDLSEIVGWMAVWKLVADNRSGDWTSDEIFLCILEDLSFIEEGKLKSNVAWVLLNEVVCWMRFWEEIVDNELDDCIVDDVSNSWIVILSLTEDIELPKKLVWVVSNEIFGCVVFWKLDNKPDDFIVANVPNLIADDLSTKEYKVGIEST